MLPHVDMDIPRNHPCQFLIIMYDALGGGAAAIIMPVYQTRGHGGFEGKGFEGSNSALR